MNPIKDSVHDHVPVGPVAAALLDTEPVQRLRHITQLSTVQLVYPSANHTRFEHSLGVYHLARRQLSYLDEWRERLPPGERDDPAHDWRSGLDADGRAAEHVRAAALLHDVGHGPFGHQTEDVIARHGGGDHDEIRALLDHPELAAVLADHDLDPDLVAALVDGDTPVGPVISGPLDVDRMDYLLRDRHHVGVEFGGVEAERLMRKRIYDDGPLLPAANAGVATQLIQARTWMNTQVYQHRVSRIAGAMLERASERLLRDGVVDVAEFARWTDDELLVATMEALPAFGRAIKYRDLYDVAATVPADAVPAALRPTGGHVDEATWRAIREVEADLAAVAGVDAEHVVVDPPRASGLKEARARVQLPDGSVRRLKEVTRQVEAAVEFEQSRLDLGVYAPEEVVGEVGRAAEGTFEDATVG